MSACRVAALLACLIASVQYLPKFVRGRFNPVYRQTHERTNSLERRLRKAMIRLPHSGNLNELTDTPTD
ncbi:unnamed protein product [Nesidiocoris tenuis]|uniref:Uncharacterized protein n=1 Tax=Nesidiocoris tenuis TaxID=355587 RepID=A0A6H5GKZ9_9HEMI|nr:unnamed protein product [Nesidiocoris tenuis]